MIMFGNLGKYIATMKQKLDAILKGKKHSENEQDKLKKKSTQKLRISYRNGKHI